MHKNLELKIIKIINDLTPEELCEVEDFSVKYGHPTFSAPSNKLKVHYRTNFLSCNKEYYFVKKECYFTKVNPKGNLEYYFHVD